MAEAGGRTRSISWLGALVAAASSVWALTACSGASPPAPTIPVVTTIYPLAQAVSAIGGRTVSVVDLATPGVDPRTQVLTAAQADQVRRAAVVFDVGDGFQPAVEQVAGGQSAAHSVVSLAPRFGPAANGAWLDPALMATVAPVIAAALKTANPAAAGEYSNGQQDFSAQVRSTSIDYQSGLADCAKKDVAAPDSTLATLASQYRLSLHQLGATPTPTAAQVATAAATISSAGITTAFFEPWASPATVRAAARRSGAKVRGFDTLEAPPAGGWPPGSTYLSLLATNLGTLTSALVCQTNAGQ
ncbi:MAG: metal ABC transporter substrate-binding protein [Actinomycetota bacterium]|nr:metal ABC transporter substrate-binding protein [Actinomycetota bacterium]